MQNVTAWTFIDQHLIKHLELSTTDSCFYYLVRLPGGYTECNANQRISNFKKSMQDCKTNPALLNYKQAEISRFANDVVDFLQGPLYTQVLQACKRPILVPIPPSRPKEDPLYDDRMSQLCLLVSRQLPSIGYEEIFDIKQAVLPVHIGGSRSIEEIKSNIIINRPQTNPDLVVLIDDVITKGAHFVAYRQKLQELYPAIPIIGLFLAIHKSSWVDYEGSL